MERKRVCYFIWGKLAGVGSGRAFTSGTPMDDIEAREQALLVREAKLAEKEEMLERRAAELGGETTNMPPNWPLKRYPIAYHDINAEIPERYQALVRRCYIVMLFTWVCLVLNWLDIMIVVLWGSAIASADSDALWSTLYVIAGIPGAWRLWYRPIYFGCRSALLAFDENWRPQAM